MRAPGAPPEEPAARQHEQKADGNPEEEEQQLAYANGARMIAGGAQQIAERGERHPAEFVAVEEMKNQRDRDHRGGGEEEGVQKAHAVRLLSQSLSLAQICPQGERERLARLDHAVVDPVGPGGALHSAIALSTASRYSRRMSGTLI